MNHPKMSPESMSPIPAEILQCYILPRLSSKSLLRFICVCKSWHTFICHPSFCTHHHLLFLSRDPQLSVFAISQPQLFSPLIHQPNKTPPPPATLLFTLPTTDLNSSDIRVQCVNGLLCFHPKNSATYSNEDITASTLIANPTTKQIVTLPFDESIGNREFQGSTQFGYDPVRDQFKVLRLVIYPNGSNEFKIFTLCSDRSWRVLTVARETHSLLFYCLWYAPKEGRGLYLDGAIHWTYKYNPPRIVAFDVGTEQFRVLMPVPSGYEENSSHLKFPNLVEIDGCLSLVGYSGSCLKLWILKDYQAQVWEHRSIDLPPGIVPPKQYAFLLCGVHISKVLLLPYFLTKRVRAIYYDMEEKSFASDVIMETSQPSQPNEQSRQVEIFFCRGTFWLLE